MIHSFNVSFVLRSARYFISRCSGHINFNTFTPQLIDSDMNFDSIFSCSKQSCNFVLIVFFSFFFWPFRSGYLDISRQKKKCLNSSPSEVFVGNKLYRPSVPEFILVKK